MRLAGARAVLTGAGGGIGAALAHRLVAAGASVLAVGRSGESLERLRARMPVLLRERVQPLVADIRDPAARARIATEATLGSRPLRLLVHAAGLPGFGAFEHGSDAGDAALFETNVLAPMALTRALLPTLRAQPDAAVVAIGSTFGSLAFPGHAAYSASKFALRGWIEAMQREYAGSGPRFQWLAPRATRTAFNAGAADRANAALGVVMDTPEQVAARLFEAIESGRPRLQLGFPESLFVRINGAFPSLVDRSLRRQLARLQPHLSAAAEGGVPAIPSPGVEP